MSQWIRKLLMGQPMSRREFLRGTMGAAASAAASRIPVPAPTAGAALPAAGPQLGPEVSADIRRGFNLLGDGSATFYPYRAGRNTGQYGVPPIYVEPSTVFDEVKPKAADDFVQLMDRARFSVPGNDTNPETGMAHPSFRFNSITGKWHPHYIERVRPNVTRDVFLEPDAPVPSQLPESIIDPVQDAFEDNPLWEQAEWPEWTQQGKSMMVEGRRRWIESQAADWEKTAKQDPDGHKQKMESDPEYRKAYNSVMEQATRGRGGWHNVGPDPFPANEMGIGGTERLDGGRPERQSASSGVRNAINRMTLLGVPAAVVAGQQEQDRKSPLQGLTK